MKKYWLIPLILILLVLFTLTGIFIYIKFFTKKVTEETEVTLGEPKTLDPSKEETHLSKVFNTSDVYWTRMGDLFWEEIEKTKGTFDWTMMDEKVKEFNETETYPLVIIKPFANWDQDTCHGDEYEAEFDPKKGGNVKVGKPCDMNAYANFLEKAVERYDGDGQNDMVGLEIPIKYWEVMNEPSMQGGSTGGMGEELKFFVGTSEEYLEILKTSYEVIKATDSEASVVQGGQAGMQKNFVDFWTPIFENGGGNYFDIANIHAISADERIEDAFVIKFKKFLKKYNLEDKPIWVTELQFGSLTEKPDDLESFEILMVRSSVFSLAQGADKLFYIENWLHWDGKETRREKTDIEEVKKTSTHKVYLNLVDKINEFDQIVVIKEEFIEYEHDSDGAHSNIGQYKFINNSSQIYVLWGDAESPSEISGEITVTDIYGKSETMDASNLDLKDEPVFVKTL